MEVIAIDSDKEKVQKVQDCSSYAILGDASKKDFLLAQGIEEMDAVVVSTGERSHLSTLITLFLKEMKVPRILVKAISEDHGRILEKVGATEVIYPEKDMAAKTARALAQPQYHGFYPSGGGLFHLRSEPSGPFHREKPDRSGTQEKIPGLGYRYEGHDLRPVYRRPPPTYVIKDSDMLILIGKDCGY